MERFAGRVAVVTGAAAGIGAEISAQLVRAGLVVVGVDRQQQRLEDQAAALSTEKGKFYPLVADISREEEVRRVFQWVDDNLGGVSVLVNNAGIHFSQPIHDLDAASIQRIVAVNLTAAMLSSREAIQSMKRHDIKDGHIININSALGHRLWNFPNVSSSAYSATKFGITSLCQGLRYDLTRLEGFRTRVTSVSPGTVATDLVPESFRKDLKDPDQVLQPRDIADAVLYALSSPAAVEIAEISLNAIAGRL